MPRKACLQSNFKEKSDQYMASEQHQAAFPAMSLARQQEVCPWAANLSGCNVLHEAQADAGTQPLATPLPGLWSFCAQISSLQSLHQQRAARGLVVGFCWWLDQCALFLKTTTRCFCCHRWTLWTGRICRIVAPEADTPRAAICNPARLQSQPHRALNSLISCGGCC